MLGLCACLETKPMANTIKARAMRLALQTAKREYDSKAYPRNTLTDVIAYLTVKVRDNLPAKPEYRQLPMFAIAGRPTGKYHCQHCGQHFGENQVSRLQSKRAYLTLHYPHCGQCWYTDNSQ